METRSSHSTVGTKFDDATLRKYTSLPGSENLCNDYVNQTHSTGKTS